MSIDFESDSDDYVLIIEKWGDHAEKGSHDSQGNNRQVDLRNGGSEKAGTSDYCNR